MEKEKKVTLEDAIEHGLKENEFEAFENFRTTPNSTELGIFPVCGQSTALIKIPF